MAKLRRLDAELVRRGLARSRQQASELITDGRVVVHGAVATKPATHVDPAVGIHVKNLSDEPGWASRGAYKLLGALEVFDSIAIAERRALDAGASTGGFTDVLLRKGAREVIAADVGYGQLVWELQQNPRVHVMDRTNVRELTPEDLPYSPDLIVSDLSFISLTLVIPALARCALPGADMVLMVKPQFEVGKERLGSGGVVRDRGLRADAVWTVAQSAWSNGWGTAGVAASPLPGPSGNVEFFLHLRRDANQPVFDTIQAVVESGPA